MLGGSWPQPHDPGTEQERGPREQGRDRHRLGGKPRSLVPPWSSLGCSPPFPWKRRLRIRSVECRCQPLAPGATAPLGLTQIEGERACVCVRRQDLADAKCARSNGGRCAVCSSLSLSPAHTHTNAQAFLSPPANSLAHSLFCAEPVLWPFSLSPSPLLLRMKAALARLTLSMLRLCSLPPSPPLSLSLP